MDDLSFRLRRLGSGSFQEAASFLGVSPRTLYRWIQQGSAPRPVLRLLEAREDLGALATGWEGWRLSADLLISPEGLMWRPSEVSACYWWRLAALA